MICWYCHWGWPKLVAEIYQRALKALDGQDSPLNYGPGHVVWADENFELAEVCLKEFENYSHQLDYSEHELLIARQSLEELSKLPLSVKCVEPEDYDGEHPELFPPAKGIEMVKNYDEY